MTRQTYALFNFSHLRANYQQAKALADGLAYAVVKANAYGHGMLECAKALADADGFAVSCVDEAVQLRAAGVRQPVLVLQGAYSATEWQLAAQHQLEMVLHHSSQLDTWAQAKLGTAVSVFLKINSGMNRVGFTLDEVDEVLAKLQHQPLLSLKCVMTHFATADDAQSAAFEQQLSYMASRSWPAPFCLSNSAALYRVRTAAGKPLRDAISRPGIILYGASPLEEKSATELSLKPVMTLCSEVISLHGMHQGERIGYAGTWQAKRETRVAVVAIGYGDGYPRQAPNGTPVLIDGVECPLIGRVSMDMITVDVTDHPQVHIGSKVELWGEQLLAERVAQHCHTISYELFCRVTSRVQRVIKKH